jgi:4'-phosphopantetheinyl transferase
MHAGVSEVDVWIAYYDEIQDRALLDAYRSILTAEEREQGDRFHFARDRQRHLVTRALVRTVLSRYVDRAPSSWRFVTNDYGRPRIADAGADPLDFNVSHTHAAIVMAVSRAGLFGVDVENHRDRPAAIDVASHFFSPDEAAALLALPIDQQPLRFYEYWTFKESYIKARGMGLSIPLHAFTCELDHPGHAALRVDASENDLRCWELIQYRPRPQYLMALCIERADERPARITTREVVPMRSERLVELVPTRRSRPANLQLRRSATTLPSNSET